MENKKSVLAILKRALASMERQFDKHPYSLFFTCNEIDFAAQAECKSDIARRWSLKAFYYCLNSRELQGMTTDHFHYDDGDFTNKRLPDEEANEARLIWMNFLILWVESGELDHTFLE